MDGLFFVWAASCFGSKRRQVPAVRFSFRSGPPVLQHRFPASAVAVSSGKTRRPARKAAAAIRAATDSLFQKTFFGKHEMNYLCAVRYGRVLMAFTRPERELKSSFH